MMRIGRGRFAPPLWAVLAYLVVAVAMLALGRWQLERAAEKRERLAALEAARARAAVPLEQVENVAEAAREHRRVVVSGRWIGERQLLWDNRAHAGRAGFEVITPIALDDGRLALVNRGWIAPGPTREALPDASLPDAVAALPARLEGVLSRPSRGFSSGPALAEGPGDWPRTLQHFDYAAIARALGAPLLEAVVQAQVAGDGESGGAALGEARAELLTPNWRPAASGPEKHYGYAFQWFAMAAGLTVVFVVVNARGGEGEGRET